MSTVKQQVRQVLEQLPDDCTIEDVQYHLYVADLIRRRVESSETAAGIPHEKVVERFAKWRTQSSDSPKPPKTSSTSSTSSVKRRRRTRAA